MLYDDAQSIYQGAAAASFNFASVGIEARGRTSVLRLNYRNTAEVLALAVRCADSLLHDEATTVADEDRLPLVEPASAGRHGPMPLLIDAHDPGEEAELLAERIAALQADGVPLSEIAVVLRTRTLMAAPERALRRRGIALQSMRDEAFRRFDWRADSVKLLTMHSAKGLEFAHVFVAGLQALPHRDAAPAEELRLLYVAMTRATQALVLSAGGGSPVVDRVREALAHVQRGFARA